MRVPYLNETNAIQNQNFDIGVRVTVPSLKNY